MSVIKKAVFPVAGLGTRFLPATKATPKEMLPIVDKPLIQYAVEEAVAAGITEMIFITCSNKQAVENHFDSNYELESKLEARGKYQLLSLVRDILPKEVTCSYVRQSEQLGLGHAVLCAKHLVGNQPFAVLLADDLIDTGARCAMEQMVSDFEERHASIIGVEPVDAADTYKYGIVKLDEAGSRLKRITRIVEKPRSEDAPSNLSVVGRYILTPRIFSFLEATSEGAGGEIQLTDAISQLLAEEDVYAHILSGDRYDCGSKLGYVKATMAYALKRQDIGPEFSAYLKGLQLEQVLSDAGNSGSLSEK